MTDTPTPAPTGTCAGRRMTAEMADQPAVLAHLVARFDDDVAAVRALVPPDLAGTVFLGRGSSDNAAQLGRYLAEVASCRPAGLAAISLHTRRHARVDHRGYLVAAFSQSGRTPEVVAATEAVRRAGAVTVAVTNDPASPLAAAADLVLPLAAAGERAVPATKTVTAQMLLAAAVAVGVGRDGVDPGGAGAVGDGPIGSAQLAGLAPAVAATLIDSEPADELARRWAQRATLLVVARGLGLAAATETALKVGETAAVFAHGMSTADLLHGPIAAVRPEVPVLLVGTGPTADPDLDQVDQVVTATGADVARWPAAPGLGPDASGSLAGELVATIVATVRGQQLARAWSLARGLDPDRPAGLSKVTLTH